MGWSPGVNATAAVSAPIVPVRSGLQGTRDSQRQAVCDRLPQRTSRRVRHSRSTSSRGASPTRRSRRASRRSESRRSGATSSSRTRGRMRRRRTTSRQPGQGYVDEFTPDGVSGRQVVNSGKKNAPLNAAWGLALAPADFSVFGGYLLVGNFGNGRISAYMQTRRQVGLQGPAAHADGSPIAIDGLWAIAFGNGAAAGPTNTLYFLSGPCRGGARTLRIDHGGLTRDTRVAATATRKGAGRPAPSPRRQPKSG